MTQPMKPLISAAALAAAHTASREVASLFRVSTNSPSSRRLVPDSNKRTEPRSNEKNKPSEKRGAGSK